MARDGGHVRLIARPGAGPQPGDATRLAPCGQRQSPDAIRLVQGYGGGPQPGDAVRLMPCLGGLPLGAPPPAIPDYPPPFRGPAPVVGLPYTGRHAQRLRPHTAPGWTGPPQHPRHTTAPWGDGTPQHRHTGSAWARLPERPRSTTAPWAATDDRSRHTESRWNHVPPARTHTGAPWGATLEPRSPHTDTPHSEPPPRRPEIVVPWGPDLALIHAHTDTAFRGPPRLWAFDDIPWQQAGRLPWDYHPDVAEPEPEPEPEPGYIPPAGDALHFRLRCPRRDDVPGDGLHFLLSDLPCPPTPYQPGSAITVHHQISVTRASDGAAVPTNSLTLTTDMDSWTWDCQADLRGPGALDLVRPGPSGPREIQITIDGQTWAIIAETTQEDRRDDSRTRRVDGRGPAAVFARPYATARSRQQDAARNAQQLATEELEFTGWTLQWDAVDWLVPGGTWAYTDKTPMQAITQIAEAIGAFAQSDPVAQTIRVASRYPVSPWNWGTATPDATIPGRFIRQAQERWIETPAFNRAWVAGRTNGVLVSTTRAGTAGDAAAPQVVDDLSTHVDAGRERGRVILAGSGPAIEISLEMPFVPAPDGPGLILPGHLVQVDDPAGSYRALAKAVQIQVQGASVSQTIELERRITT